MCKSRTEITVVSFMQHFLCLVRTEYKCMHALQNMTPHMLAFKTGTAQYKLEQ